MATKKTTTKKTTTKTDSYKDPKTGQTYVGGNGYTAKQVAAQYGVKVDSSPAPSTKTTTPTKTSTAKSSSSGTDYNSENDPSKYYRDPKTGTLYASQDVARQQGITITPESLAPATVEPFTQPNESPVPDVKNLYETPDLTMTATEQQAQGMTESIQKLNTQLLGKNSYQNEQDAKFGVDTAGATVTDLGTQLTTLKNEAAAIPLQLQQGAAERGVTTPTLQKQQNSRLRTNAIAALGVSSLMAAAEGQLATAKSMSDRAVAAKFAPIEEQITASMNNLNLILNSPAYSLEQKNRAQKQMDIQNEKQAKIAEDKAKMQTINAIALEVAANGGDALTLQKIQNAKDPIEATGVAAVFAQEKNYQKAAQSAGITTPAVNDNGIFFDAKTGKVYKDPETFFRAVGVSSFAEAYAKNLVTDMKSNFTKTGVTSYDEWQLYQASGGKLSYDEYQTMDANRKRSVSNTTINNSTTDMTKEFDLRVKQAPAQVRTLKNDGRNWGEIVDYFTSLSIPITPDIDDALHASFQSQKDYEKWKESQ